VVFFLIGVGAALLGDVEIRNPAIVFSLVGCLFVGIGGAFYWFMTRPIGFDRAAGRFWKRQEEVPLDWIHAIQLICESRKGSWGSGESGFDSCEINLVLKDGSRINVVDHGNLGRIRQDSRQLGEFLGVGLGLHLRGLFLVFEEVLINSPRFESLSIVQVRRELGKYWGQSLISHWC
jgi:hypothetical protein